MPHRRRLRPSPANRLDRKFRLAPPRSPSRSTLPGKTSIAGNCRLRQIHRADLVAHLPPRRALPDLADAASSFRVSPRFFSPSSHSLPCLESPRVVVACRHRVRRAEVVFAIAARRHRCRLFRRPCEAMPPDRKSTRLNSSHSGESRMPSSA